MNDLEAFINYLELEKHYSVHTVKAYKKDLESFKIFITEDTFNRPDTIIYGDIRSWIIDMVNSGISNRSINRKVSSLNSYFKFLIKIERCKVNPLKKHKALKVEKTVQIPFSKSEMIQVLDALSKEYDFVSIRDKAIVELFYSTGIRRIELVDLKLKDINWSNSTIKVLGKRNKERIIPLIPSVSGTLKSYIDLRAGVELADSEALFITEKGAKIYEMLVYRIINKYFSRASSKLKCSPHVLRHSFATHLLNEGADINSVKELLGHASLAATQVYTHNSIAELKKAYNRSHPRNQ
ncbi:tyrosine-type recombinase/integrase [Winogradskyella aurantiaca]|uniref:tyrosine-type recombinase/integrase n=1 Tax=Winogradskyella aurantiaca TaxID=2219558 RepID=UPI000E1E00FE|nr:tyrosine-type recombinase/integrase [Winogradskyella aurantiaca]